MSQILERLAAPNKPGWYLVHNTELDYYDLIRVWPGKSQHFPLNHGYYGPFDPDYLVKCVELHEVFKNASNHVPFEE